MPTRSGKQYSGEHNILTCNQCHKSVNKGYFCGFMLMCPIFENGKCIRDEPTGEYSFKEFFCDSKCMSEFLETPRIYGFDYVQHFYCDDTNKFCNKHYDTTFGNNIKKYDQFLIEYEHAFLGEPKMSKKTKMLNKSYDATSDFLLNICR
jgi:hypothetical protein